MLLDQITKLYSIERKWNFLDIYLTIIKDTRYIVLRQNYVYDYQTITIIYIISSHFHLPQGRRNETTDKKSVQLLHRFHALSKESKGWPTGRKWSVRIRFESKFEIWIRYRLTLVMAWTGTSAFVPCEIATAICLVLQRSFPPRIGQRRSTASLVLVPTTHFLHIHHFLSTTIHSNISSLTSNVLNTISYSRYQLVDKSNIIIHRVDIKNAFVGNKIGEFNTYSLLYATVYVNDVRKLDDLRYNLLRELLNNKLA